MITPPPPELVLPSRSGRLPADIAYLLAKYPREDWPVHDNFAGMAESWIQRHDFFRELGGMLKTRTAQWREEPGDPAQFQRFLSSRLNLFLGHLEGHHNVEDYAYFPRFRALDPRLVIGFDLLENDHGVIHEQLDLAARSGEAFYQALFDGTDAARTAADDYAETQDRLVGWLLRHLKDEEDLLVPAILEHTQEAIGG